MLRKILIWLAALLFLLITALTIVRSIREAMVESLLKARLEARLQALRGAGDPVTAEDLAALRPAIPPGHNAAPLFLAGFKKMTRQYEDPQAKALPIVGEGKLPQPGTPLPASMVDSIRAYLEKHAEAMRLLREAVAVEECRFEIDFTGGVLSGTGHLSGMRDAAHLFALEAVERMEHGRLDGAAERLRWCLRCGSALRDDPVLFSGFARMACDAVAVRCLERWTSAADPSPETCSVLEEALHAEADTRMFERIFVGERCLLIVIYRTQLLVEGPRGYRRMVNAGLLFDIGQMDKAVAAARRPYPSSLIAGARLSCEQPPEDCPSAGALLPAFDRVFRDGQYHMARVESARVALAALRCKAKNGRLPEKLQDLLPDFIDAVPPDPFDGKPLRYRKTKDGFVIYAIGENGKDDGGKTEAAKGPPADVGFRVRWPKARF